MLQYLERKKYGILFFAIMAACLFLGRQGLDKALSDMVAVKYVKYGEVYSNASAEVTPLGEVLAGDVLRQPLYFEDGLLPIQLGVGIGTYIRDNEADYVLAVYDGDGNIIGKREIHATQMLDNQMCYVPINARTSRGQSYYLTVESPDASPGNAVTCYGVGIAEGHGGVAWNGQEMGMELVTEVIYQAVFPIAEYMLLVVAAGFLIYLFWEKAKEGCTSLIRRIGEVASCHGKKLLCGCVLAGIGCVLLLLLFPGQEDVLLRGGPDEDNAVIRPYTGKWSQELTATGEFDAIEVKLATYEMAYGQGELVLALYDAGNNGLLLEKRVPAEEIKDNQFLRIDVGGIGQEGTYYMEMWTEGFGGQPLALYCAKEGESLIYRLVRQEKDYRVLTIFRLTLFVAVAGIWYFCLSTGIKRQHKELLVTGLLSVVAGILVNTYANYREVSIPAVAKNLGLLGKAAEVSVDGAQVREATTRNYSYSPEGKLYAIYDTISLKQVYSRVDTITLYYADVGNRIGKYSIYVNVDTGDGLHMMPESNHEYAYGGQGSLCVPVGEADAVKTIMLGYGFMGVFGDITPEEQYYALERIVLNESPVRMQVWSWTFLVGVFIVWLLYAWQHFKLEGHFRNLEGKGNFEVRIFVVAALGVGLAMLFLLPAGQTPDELYHVRHALESIGAGDIYKEIEGCMGDAVRGVQGSGVVRVDWKTYHEKLSRHLSTYPASFSLHMEILKYPGAALGTLIGLLLHLSVGWILFLGEALALLLYIVIGALAIKITPVKRKLFLLLLLLPMAMQQAASYSYDSFNNAVSMLAVSYCLYLALEKERVRWDNLAKLAVMLFPLLYIKKVYVLCGLLVLLIPYQKLPLVSEISGILNTRRKKWAAAMCAIMFLLLVAVVAVKVVPGLVGVSGIVESFFLALMAPKEFLLMLGRTVIVQAWSWMKWFSACFGWLDTITAEWMVWLVFIELLAAAFSMGWENRKPLHWGRKQYFVCMGSFLLTSVLIIFSMLGWTQTLRPVSGGTLNQLLVYPVIEGVQGRYFIPIIILPLLFPVSHKIQDFVNRLPLRLCLFCGWIVMVAYTVVTLLNRYWI